MVAYEVVFSLELQGLWAAMSAVIVSQERLHETRSSLAGRILGTLLGIGVTVAVKVTAWPTVEGFADEASAVAVATVFTVCVRAGDVLAEKFASPGYAAVMECPPTASDEMFNVAAPDAFSAPLPIIVAPSRKRTVPVGVPGAPSSTSTNNMAPVSLMCSVRARPGKPALRRSLNLRHA